MKHVERIARKKIVWRGLLSSTIQIVPSFVYGFALYYAGHLIANGDIHYKQVIR